MTDRYTTSPDAGKTELLPCPFCGEQPGNLIDATRILGVWRLIHRCPAIGPLSIERSDRDSIVAAWNRRAGSHE